MGAYKHVIFRRLLPPYDDYKSSGPRFHKTEGRMLIDCLDIKHGSQHQMGMLYSRYLYEVTHGKIPEGYEIDHIDGDKTNDSLDNLQAIPATINNIKGTRQSTLINNHCKNHVLVRCPICGKWVDTPRVKYNKAVENGSTVFCGRPCLYKANKYKVRLTQPHIEYQPVPEQPYKHITPPFEQYSTPMEQRKIHRCPQCGKEIPTQCKLCGECNKNKRFPPEAQQATINAIQETFKRCNRFSMLLCSRLLGISDKAVAKRCVRMFGKDYKRIIMEKFRHP